MDMLPKVTEREMLNPKEGINVEFPQRIFPNQDPSVKRGLCHQIMGTR
jgi:hypothetical protein